MEHNEHDVLTVDVGSRLRQLRTERNRSMRDVARSSGLSTNALSMIERGKASPSVSTLYKISDALGVPITAFFRYEPTREQVIFRKSSERKRVNFFLGLWEGLGGEAFTGQMEPFVVSLEPDSSSGPFGMLHSGSEFVYCLAGQIEYTVEDTIYLMQAGDSLLFAAHLRHRWRNVGDGKASAVIVLSNFEQGENPSEYHLASKNGSEPITET